MISSPKPNTKQPHVELKIEDVDLDGEDGETKHGPHWKPMNRNNNYNPNQHRGSNGGFGLKESFADPAMELRAKVGHYFVEFCACVCVCVCVWFLGCVCVCTLVSSCVWCGFWVVFLIYLDLTVGVSQPLHLFSFIITQYCSITSKNPPSVAALINPLHVGWLEKLGSYMYCVSTWYVV